MFLSLTVCINQPDNFNQFASRSDETIRALKERICHKFNLNPMTLDLRTLQEGRDLNKDEMLVGHLGITNDTIIMAYVGKQSAPPQVSKNSFMRQQQPALDNFSVAKQPGYPNQTMVQYIAPQINHQPMPVQHHDHPSIF